MQITLQWKRALLGMVAVCALGSVTSPAHASIVTLGDTANGPELNAGDIGLFGDYVTGSANAAESFFFTLGETVNLEASVLAFNLGLGSFGSFGIPDLTFDLVDLDNGSSILGSGTNSLTLASLTSGNYRLDIFGTAANLGGAYLGALAVSAVPLPAAAWLLLSGLAGVGMVSRRRRNVAA